MIGMAPCYWSPTEATPVNPVMARWSIRIRQSNDLNPGFNSIAGIYQNILNQLVPTQVAMMVPSNQITGHSIVHTIH
jgi:hypothetical protein